MCDLKRVKAMKKILSVIVCFIVLSSLSLNISAETNQAAVDDVRTATEFNGSYYKVYDDVELTWVQANEFCKSLGGHLVTITSETEQRFVENLLRTHDKNFYWLGAYESQNQWIWVTDEPFSYSYWEIGQPDDGRGDENYLMLYNKVNVGNNLYTWNDITNAGVFPGEDFWGVDRSGIICEWEFACVSENGCYETHDWTKWETTIAATCYVSGESQRFCTHCQKTEQMVIEQLSHNYGDMVVISGSKLIPPIVKERVCEFCHDAEYFEDWSYVWVTVLAGVATLGAVIGVIGYIRAFKKK